MAQDLAERNINITDIVTPTANKTHGLFQEITSLLHGEYNFATAGTPLVFEATMSHDTLSVLVTKMPDNNEHGEYNENYGTAGFQNIINNIMTQLENNGYNQEGLEFMSAAMHPHGGFPNGHVSNKNRQRGNVKGHTQRKRQKSDYTVFSFESFDMLAEAASHIPESYKGRSHVYKRNGKNHLMLQNIGTNEYCTKKFESKLSEYGQKQLASPITYNQMQEHGETIIAEDAICKLKAYHGI